MSDGDHGRVSPSRLGDVTASNTAKGFAHEMGILRDFERRLGGAVEGFFARAFRSGLQPVELAKAAQRYAADYQQVGLDGVFVPNVYRFSLSEQDMERFRDFAHVLAQELADVVERTAAERSWRLQGPARIELRQDPGVKIGTYELRGKVEPAKPAEPAERLAPVPSQPAPVAEPASPAPAASVLAPTGRARLRVDEGPEPGQHFAVGQTAVIGRLPECDITLDDPSVSRRHARVVREDGEWLVEDLGSTNGIRVNGRQVQRGTLKNGDSLRLGGVHLTFTLER